MEFIDLREAHRRIEIPLKKRFERIFETTQFIMGPEILELEEVLAKYVGAKHCISCSSGTDALLIAMMALNIKPGDEVITTPFSFFATVETILLLGANPIFVDIEEKTYNMNPDLIEAAITPRTKAIVPVSLYGQCANFEKINATAAKLKIPVIEDAAQSFGATHYGKRSCGLTKISATSFFPSKPLGCYGDGGAIFTDDDDLAKAMREIRVHGQSSRYVHTRLGVNGRMDTLQAAVVIEKMKIFDEEIALRQKVAKRYEEGLSKDFKTPFVEEFNQSVYAQYTIEVSDRDAVIKSLKEEGIPTAVHYPKGLHQQLALKNFNFLGLGTTKLEEAANQAGKSFPVAERAAERVVSLPMHPYLSEADQSKVVEALRKIEKASPSKAVASEISP